MLMTIRLNQQELNEAVSGWLSSHGIDLHNKELEIDLVNGRKGTGDYATVTIREGVSDADRQEEYDMDDNHVEKEINIGPVTPAVVLTEESKPTPVAVKKKSKQTKLNKSEKLIPEIPEEEEAMDAKEEAEILETVSAPDDSAETKEAEVNKTTSLFG